jgi:hypothetical protein
MMPEREITPHPLMRHHATLKEDFRAQFDGFSTKLSKLARDLLYFDATLRAHLHSIAERAARTAAQ